MTLDDCLAYLGLDADADEGSVRRAYELKLKKIGQAPDPQGRHKLRQAYEVLLDWVHSRLKQTQQTSSQTGLGEMGAARAVPPPPSSSSQAADAGQAAVHARDVWRELGAVLPVLVGQGPQVVLKVQACLADARLLDEDARTAFEGLIAHWLVQGWKPGNQELFEAAASLFNWTGDKRRLQRFGHAGVTLEAACDEWSAFKALSRAQQIRLKDLLVHLRGRRLPPMERLLHKYKDVEDLLTQMPNWLHIVANAELARRWTAAGRDQFQFAIDPEEAEPPPVPVTPASEAERKARAAKSGSSGKRRKWWLYAGVGLLLLAVLGAGGGFVWWRFFS